MILTGIRISLRLYERCQVDHITYLETVNQVRRVFTSSADFIYLIKYYTSMTMDEQTASKMQSLIHDLSFNNRNKLIWTGSFEALQQFVQEVLDLNEGDWTSPGADAKLFVAKEKDVAIKWYAKSQTVSVSGDDRENVEDRLKSVASMAKSLSDVKNSEEQTKDRLLETTLETLNNKLQTLEEGISSKMSSVTDILLVHSKELRELKNLDSDTELSWLRKENARLKDENEKITERVNNLSFVLADLQDKAARANEEKDSLMTSIRLLFKDLESTQPINVNHLETPHDQQQAVLECSSDTKDTNSEHVVTIPTKNSFSPLLVEETNTNDNETDADNENNKRQQRDSTTQTVKKDHNSHKKPKDKPAYEQRAGSETGHRLNVAIIGDSMVKHLNPSKLRKGTKHNINVQTFSGANVADMRYYVKPTISRSPDYLLLHVGTNDLKRQTPQQIAGSISTLCQEIVKESPNTKIVLSKVITRSDDSSLDSKIKELNCKLSQVCHNNKWGVLNHTNITADHLNPYGLHLNKQGTAKLAKNIIDHFKNLN